MTESFEAYQMSFNILDLNTSPFPLFRLRFEIECTVREERAGKQITTAQVVETSVTTTNNNPSMECPHPLQMIRIHDNHIFTPTAAR